MKRRRYPPQVAMKKAVQEPNPRISRVQRFLKQIIKEDVREKYIQTVDQHVNRLLDSVRVKEFKSSGKRGVNNRPKSQQAQINESKDRVDVTSPYSILTHVSNPRLLLNPQTFASLPMFYQYKLVKVLPACDQIVTEQGWIKPSSTSLTNEFFTKASMEWIESLKEGRFTQEYLSKKKQDIERDRHKLDPWKVRNFEPIWGQKQISQDDSIDEYHRIPRTVIPYSGPRNMAPKPDFCDDDEEDVENGLIPVFTEEISIEADMDVTPRKRLRTSTAASHVEQTSRLEETHELVPISLKESASTTEPSRKGKHPSPILTRRGTRSSTAASRREKGKAETTTSRVNSSNDDDDELLRRLLPEILPESAVFRTPKGYDTSFSTENVLSSGIIISAASSISSKAKESPVAGSPSKTTHLLTISTSGNISSSTHLAHGDDFNSSFNLHLNESTSPSKMSSSSRRHRRQRISAPLKHADGVDEMGPQPVCQKAIEDSNRLFFVTNHGRIQQFNQNIDQTNLPLRESNNVPSSSQTSNNQPLITSTTTKIPLTSDVEIIPVASSPSKFTLVQPDGQRREVDFDHSEKTNNLIDKQNILSSILTSKITKNDYQKSSEILPILPYKLPNDITITPTFTATTSSNQVPVITRTEQNNTSCNTETSHVWVTGSAISNLSTTAIVSPANSSDEDCEGVFTRLPPHITVIPLGPTPETSASEEEADFSMMNGHAKGEEDDQQSPGNMQYECACDLKAMIPCANCSALCHQDCITSVGFCMPCHYNQDIYSAQPLPSGIVNSSSAY